MTARTVEPAAMPVPPSLAGYRYEPRAVAFRGWRPVGRWRVKLTVVTLTRSIEPADAVLSAAWAESERLLACVPDENADAGVAHLTVHIGLAGVWLLLDWWAEGDILMHRHFQAPLDQPTLFVDVAARHVGPCVWELAVQAHERAAWLRHVLARAGGPDLQAYLEDGLTGVL